MKLQSATTANGSSSREWLFIGALSRSLNSMAPATRNPAAHAGGRRPVDLGELVLGADGGRRLFLR